MAATVTTHSHATTLPNNGSTEGRAVATALPKTYLEAATSDHTRRSYQGSVRHFEKWGGQLPAKKEAILAYLHRYAPDLNPDTLSLRLTALRKWHECQGFDDPTTKPEVAKTLAGIRRLHGQPKKKAPPLLPQQLAKIVASLNQQATLMACRDVALLQVGYFGALRRSELVAIRCEHLNWQTGGLELMIPRSKTDSTGEGQLCVLPYGNATLCPITALKQWLESANIESGYCFCAMQDKSRVKSTPLTDEMVTIILRRHALAVGIEQADQMSSHSLRRGLATSAARDGASMPAIMRQGRWRNTHTVMEYIDAANRFDDNAAAFVLNEMIENE